MKIAILGDSITEGVPGVSYVDILKQHFTKDELINYGKGGDTISSLLKRSRKIEDLSSYDSIVLFVGVNDLFGKLTSTYRVLKVLMKQVWAKNEIEFSKQYKQTIEFLLTKTDKLFVIPPLFIGEEVNNKWNKQLDDYVASIEAICKSYSNVTYVDVRTDCITYLEDKSISGYMPFKISELLKDVKELKTNEDVDERSKNRGLHLTLDGVHINSKGAKIIADGIIKAITI